MIDPNDPANVGLVSRLVGVLGSTAPLLIFTGDSKSLLVTFKSFAFYFFKLLAKSAIRTAFDFR